jgi:hypothetical protein
LIKVIANLPTAVSTTYLRTQGIMKKATNFTLYSVS